MRDNRIESISVIIPNYNGEQLLKEYLPHTIKALQHSGAQYEIIIVDDGSKDNSVEFITRSYPEITLIINTENRGFSHSCNRGIEVAENQLIFLLNSDVKLSENYFDQQFRYFSREDTFGVMGRIIDMEGDGIQDAARIPRFNGFKLKTDFYYPANPTTEMFTLYLSGANALIDARKLKEVGGFNEIFTPFYGEDLELSIRAWRFGWKCYYEHQAVCRHKGSASTNTYKTPDWVKGIYYRNRLYVHAMHLEASALIMWFLQITFIDLFVKLSLGHSWVWRSYKEALWNIKKLLHCRAALKRQMKLKGSNLSLSKIGDIIKSSIENGDIIRLDKGR